MISTQARWNNDYLPWVQEAKGLQVLGEHVDLQHSAN
jgi:hypothetical protein